MNPKLNISHANIREMLERHVPQAAVSYCLSLWLHYPFHFRITRQRKTKQGDYRYYKREKSHTITINHNLNPYSFLITYIHEIAHLETFQQFGFKIAPHGLEWKNHFRTLMRPLLLPSIFPDDILLALSRYLQNPKASTCSDPGLIRALQQQDANEGFITLADVQLNRKFRFNQRVFLKEEVKRTRAWCREVKTGKCYTVAESALVEII